MAKKKEEVKEVVKEVVKVEVKKERPAAATSFNMWSAEPDMGTVKPEDNRECNNCPHLKAVHYGGVNDWCNTSGCKCQMFD